MHPFTMINRFECDLVFPFIAPLNLNLNRGLIIQSNLKPLCVYSVLVDCDISSFFVIQTLKYSMTWTSFVQAAIFL